MAIHHPIPAASNRRPAGTPAGGQFAPEVHAEPELTLVSDPPATNTLPDWGPELNDVLVDSLNEEALGALAFKGSDALVDVSIPDALGATPGALAERYGPGRGAWLSSLRLVARQDGETEVERPSISGPGFWESSGSFTIYRQTESGDETLDQGSWNSEDGLDMRVPLDQVPES